MDVLCTELRALLNIRADWFGDYRLFGPHGQSVTTLTPHGMMPT